MLAVKVDFETKLATIGTQAGDVVPTGGILAALETIGYEGQLIAKLPSETNAATIESDEQ